MSSCHRSGRVSLSWTRYSPCLFGILNKTDVNCQFNGPTLSDPILSKRRIADTLTYGYLEMLGTLSKHKEGIECVLHPGFMLSPSLLTTWAFSTHRLLEKFKIFTAFYHLSELRSREDLMKLIIENLDYSMYAAWLSLFLLSS